MEIEGIIGWLMTYVYLFYGLAFIALGLVMALQARSPLRVLPVDSVWLLALFGLLHGAHEWVTMFVMLQANTADVRTLASVQSGNLLLLAVSFAFLIQFGIELEVELKKWPAWSRASSAIMLVLTLILIAVVQPINAFASPEWLATTAAIIRYILAFPGSLLAAYSLYVTSREARKVGIGRIESYLLGSAAAFVAYAFFTGLIVSPAPFFPASWLNTENFAALIHIPVEVFRGICAVGIAAFLTEAFVVETTRTRAELDRLREEFIAVVAHDLRSPITTINLNAGLLERLAPEARVSARERAMLANIRTSAASLSRMVDDLLDASRIEARRLTLAKERVDLRQLIYNVIDRAAGLTKGHQVKVVMPEEVPAVEADPGRVEQILVNLLSNAAKYSYPDTEIVIGTEVTPSEVVVSVTDYGPGIPTEEIPRLFTRFYRARERGEAAAPGLGLGLYIAKGLVEAQGGRIWVESQVGKQTTFYFTLPRAT